MAAPLSRVSLKKLKLVSTVPPVPKLKSSPPAEESTVRPSNDSKPSRESGRAGRRDFRWDRLKQRESNSNMRISLHSEWSLGGTKLQRRGRARTGDQSGYTRDRTIEPRR